MKQGLTASHLIWYEQYLIYYGCLTGVCCTTVIVRSLAPNSQVRPSGWKSSGAIPPALPSRWVSTISILGVLCLLVYPLRPKLI